MQGLQEYSLNPKVHHRRMVWNKIAKRFKGIKKYATGVVLAGPEPVDAECMRNVGFNTDNFFFIDISKDAVDAARSEDLTACQADAFEFMLCNRQPLDVVHLDLCCGITQKLCDSFYKLFLCGVISAETIVYINLQRGRDEGARYPFRMKSREDGGFPNGLEKNRGFSFFRWFLETVSELLFVTSSGHPYANNIDNIEYLRTQVECNGFRRILPMWVEEDHEEFCTRIKPEWVDVADSMRECCEILTKAWNPEYFSYPSNVVKMDSVLFQNNISFCSPKTVNLISELFPIEKPVRMKVAAAKAVQTKRQNCKN